MPAMTSAFIALRFSGRLMVTQSAEARFSMRTLDVSVMGFPACCLADHRTRSAKVGACSWGLSFETRPSCVTRDDLAIAWSARVRPLLGMSSRQAEEIGPTCKDGPTPRRRASRLEGSSIGGSHRRNRFQFGLLDPDFVVMERGAADGR